MTVLDGVMLFLFFVIFGGAFAALMGFRPNLRRWNRAGRSDGGTFGSEGSRHDTSDYSSGTDSGSGGGDGGD
ncbi:MAG: hypothetical protein AAFO75_12800 [Pseudomonadota bacterium]